MNRAQALPYVSFAVDDALSERKVAEMPADARLVGWQCGFEPLFVAVWSYLGDDGTAPRVDADDAADIARDYLAERKWFAGDPTEPDYII
jgi:hypothetical protein